MFTPVSLVFSMFLGLLSFLIPVVGIILMYKALHPPLRFVPGRSADGKHRRAPLDVPADFGVVPWHNRWREPAVWVPMLLGLLLLFLPFYGRALVRARYPAGNEEPHPLHGETHDLSRSDGTKIHAEVFGPRDAPALLLTHGWSTDNTEWFYAKRQLASQFRIIVWDLTGLGQTMPRSDGDFSLESMASDLHTVLSLADGKPVLLVGHSIGGMINLTFCKLFPQEMGTQVAGVVELDSTYTNPVRTTKNSGLNLALQRPVGEPLLHTMIALSPVFRALNWLSYQEGITPSHNAESAFDGTETRGQLDLVSRYSYESSPAVVARGALAMFHWDMTPELPRITVPVLMIVGKDDVTTMPQASEKMAGTIPKAQMVQIPVGRHYSLLESNSAVNSAIAAFAHTVIR